MVSRKLTCKNNGRHDTHVPQKGSNCRAQVVGSRWHGGRVYTGKWMSERKWWARWFKAKPEHPAGDYIQVCISINSKYFLSLLEQDGSLRLKSMSTGTSRDADYIMISQRTTTCKIGTWVTQAQHTSREFAGNESTLYWQFLVHSFQPVIKIQAYLVLVGVATFSNTRYWSFDFFQYKVIYHSNTRFSLYWKKVSMMSRTTNTCCQCSGIQGQDCTNKDDVKSNTRWKHIQVSLQFKKVFLYLSWEYHPIHGIPCIGLSLFLNTRWQHFAIQGCPSCIGFWLHFIMSQYKVMSSDTKWQHFPIQGFPCIGFWQYYVSSQYKVISPNTRWQYCAIQGWPCLGL